MKHTGGSMSPFNAWVMLKGLETIHLRCDQQAKSALSLAKNLEGHAKLAQVLYPHLPSHPQHDVAKRQMGAGGTVIALDIKGGQAEAFRFLNALQIGLDLQQSRRQQKP